MKQFEFNDTKYNLPESWKDVTLKQLKQIMKAEREEENQMLKSAKIISILTGLDYDTLVNCETSLTIKLFGVLAFLDEKEIAAEKPVEHFKIGKETFYVNGLQGSVFKEFATFQKIDSDFEKKPEDGMALKLAVLCRKDGETFLEIEDDLDIRAELFEQLDAETVFRINSFFLLRTRLSKISSEASLNLLRERQESENRLQQLLTGSTVGLPWLSGWRVRLHRWTMSMLRKLPRS